MQCSVGVVSVHLLLTAVVGAFLSRVQNVQCSVGVVSVHLRWSIQFALVAALGARRNALY